MKTKAILFDTLAYSSGLKEKGIENSETYAMLLSEALTTNIYSKSEVDSMLSDAIKENRRIIYKMEKSLDERMEKKLQAEEKKREADEKKWEAEMREFREESHRLALEIERVGTKTVTILGSLIVVVGVISTFAHVIFH